jgi:tetratricopeptide (TPR) repeat protein
MIGSESFKNGDFCGALTEFDTALVYPSNYGEGKNRKKTTEAHVYYFSGLTQESRNESQKANECFEKAIGSTYQITDELYFEGLALRRLGRDCDAKAIFLKMAEAGESLIKNPGKPAYFGLDVTIPAPFEYNTDRINTVCGALLKGLGLRGLGRAVEAAESFKTARNLDPYNFKLYLYDRLFND